MSVLFYYKKMNGGKQDERIIKNQLWNRTADGIGERLARSFRNKNSF